jgi:hypothetical protein
MSKRGQNKRYKNSLLIIALVSISYFFYFLSNHEFKNILVDQPDQHQAESFKEDKSLSKKRQGRLPAEKNNLLANTTERKKRLLPYGGRKIMNRNQAPSKSVYRDYSWAEDVYAIPEKERFDHTYDELILEQYGHLIVRSENPIRLNKGPRVLVRKSNQHYALITGVYKIKLKENEDREDILKEYSLEKISEYEAINLFLGKTDDFTRIFGLKSELEKDERIQRVELEVIDRSYVTH